MSEKEKLLDFKNWSTADLRGKAWEYLQEPPICSTSVAYLNRSKLAAKLRSTTSRDLTDLSLALQTQLSKVTIAEDAEPKDRLREVHHAR